MPEDLETYQGFDDEKAVSVAVALASRQHVSNLLWRMRSGELIRLIDMTDTHLRNIALMLMGLGYSKYFAPEEIKIKWLIVLRIEWERRMSTRIPRGYAEGGDD